MSLRVYVSGCCFLLHLYIYIYISFFYTSIWFQRTNVRRDILILMALSLHPSLQSFNHSINHPLFNSLFLHIAWISSILLKVYLKNHHHTWYKRFQMVSTTGMNTYVCDVLSIVAVTCFLFFLKKKIYLFLLLFLSLSLSFLSERNKWFHQSTSLSFPSAPHRFKHRCSHDQNQSED